MNKPYRVLGMVFILGALFAAAPAQTLGAVAIIIGGLFAIKMSKEFANDHVKSSGMHTNPKPNFPPPEPQPRPRPDQPTHCIHCHQKWGECVAC